MCALLELICASGVGRIGAIVGPILTGLLLGLELPHKMNFVMIAIPAILALFAVMVLRRYAAEKTAYYTKA